MSNHGHRGVLSFRIQISPLCSECPVPCPPQVNSRHMPCASLHAAAPSRCLIISIIIIIIIIRLEIRIFRHPFSKYPTVRWKWQVRASIGTAKRDIGVCANTDRVFSPAQCVCLTMYTSKWLFKWTKWWATMDIVGCSLFGSRYLRSALNVQFHAPPQVNSRHMPCASLHAAAPSRCLIISIIVIILLLLIIIIIIRLEIQIFRHPFSKYPTVRWKWQVRASIGTAKRDIGVCANTDRVFFPRTMRVSENVYLQMAI